MTNARNYWKSQGKNMMTPDIIDYVDAPNGLLVELSQGTGFNHEPIFGVSVADADGNRLFDESQMFHSLEDARQHIASLAQDEEE